MSRARARSPLKQFVIFSFILLASPFAALAVDLDVKLEPGVALSTHKTQSDRFGFGGAATLKGLVGFEGGYVNLSAGLTFLGLPAQTGFASTDAGTAWAPSAGIRIQLPRESDAMRVQRPHSAETFYGARPWMDADMLYVRTGGLDRIGLAAAAGLSFPVGESRSFWLGPFVRFFQIFQGNRAGYDNGNANTVILGLSLETGTRLVRPAPIAPVQKGEMLACVEGPVVVRDRDGDGVPDDVDACPDMPGPASNVGCPVYDKIIVKPDMLEMKEKIQFAWNEAVILPVSHPALDEVAQALNDNKGFKVAIEGHASSEGLDSHNMDLSAHRADAVLEYLAKHGVARDRLVSEGFSSTRPLKSNTTEAGREANRRVDFVVHFIILKEGNLQ